MAPASVFYAAADAVLAAIGAPATTTSVNLLVAWELTEWPSDGVDLSTTNNPMADELVEPGATDWNSAGVQIYPSLQVGAQATAATLAFYPTLRSALIAGDAGSFFGAAGMAELSTWASGSPTGDLGYAQTVQGQYAGLPAPPAQYLGGAGGSPATSGGIPWWLVALLVGVVFLGSEEYRAHRVHEPMLSGLDADLAHLRRWMGLAG